MTASVYLILLGIFVIFSDGANWNLFRRHHVDISISKPRIIGGDEVEPHQYKYQVGLLINGNAFCGGSLISENYVLTAAHCGVVIRTVDVILGAHNITGEEDTQVHIPGETVIVHENYNRTSYQNDIALVKLSQPAPINEYVDIIKLPTQNDSTRTYEGSLTVSTGWGLAADVDHNPTLKDMSDVLRVVEVVVTDLESCAEYYNDYEEMIEYVTDLNVCTSGYKNKGTCNGDSGGPLTIEDVQIGIVSIGTDLCEECSPSIFTKVDRFLDWIQQNSDVVIS